MAMSKKILLLTSAVVLLMLAGCGTATTQVPQVETPAPVEGGTLRYDRDALPTYQSDFQIEFAGAKNWLYALQTRKSTDLRETSLHMEGVENEQNPGDIRLVTDGTTSWMTGEGTDNECVQYPNGAGMDPSFLHPEALITRAQMESALKLVGEESVGGVAMMHYQASGAAGQWSDALLDVWTERDSGMLLRFKLEGSGNDPFFGGGPGKLTATYTATGLAEAPIAPVEGCELSVPLPGDTRMFVRLPGMASFDTGDLADAVSAFYQTALPQEGWTEKDSPAQADGLIVLSYWRSAEAVEVHIETLTGGSRVKLLFMPVE